MIGLLVFDNLNDLVYLNCCNSFSKHVENLAVTQGLIDKEKYALTKEKFKFYIDPDILVQLFSPLVTSQRFMREQFGNPYTSLQCDDGTNVVFQDYLGFLFLKIGTEEIPFLKRCVGVAVSFVSYLCGCDVSLLKSSKPVANILDNLLYSWNESYFSDQTFMIEGVEQINTNPHLSSSLIKSLQQICNKVQIHLGNNLHAILIFESKILSWYSSKSSRNVSPEDLLVLMLLCQTKQETNSRAVGDNKFGSSAKSSSKQRLRSGSSVDSSAEDCESTLSNDSLEVSGIWDSRKDEIDGMLRHLVILKHENDINPYIAHVGYVQPELYLVILSEPAHQQTISLSCVALNAALEFANKPRECNSDKLLFEHLEAVTKKLQDVLKKQKSLNVRNELTTRWERFKSGYFGYLKSKDLITLQCGPIIDIYRDIFRTFFNRQILEKETDPALPLNIVWKQIKCDTEGFWGFSRMKTCSSLLSEGRDNITINKYLEEFPGLVHFLYTDRNRHMIISPNLDYSKEETIKLTKPKLWNMVKFARDHMQQGHFSLMWKDSAFNYAYFLWFEDLSGTPIRARQPAMPWENYPLPGILCGDFYRRIMNDCFPNIHPTKIRCVELFCIHLGLATSSCVLEHSKRLAMNIFDESALRNPATDLI